jgi:hypothetical protein
MIIKEGIIMTKELNCEDYTYTDEDDENPICEDCGASMGRIVDHNYGADRDGNRGIMIEWFECPNCG